MKNPAAAAMKNDIGMAVLLFENVAKQNTMIRMKVPIPAKGAKRAPVDPESSSVLIFVSMSDVMLRFSQITSAITEPQPSNSE